MAKKKTSAEMAREQSELAKVEGMLGDAFGDLGGLEQSTTEEIINETEGEEDEVSESAESNDSEQESDDSKTEMVETPAESEDQNDAVAVSSPPAGTPSGPPAGPPSKGPPSGPPGEAPSGPPSKPPSAGPPSKGPPSGPPSKGPPSKPPAGPPSEAPSGPPSKGPPSKPPAGPPSDEDEETTSSPPESEAVNEDADVEEPEQITDEQDNSEDTDSDEAPDDDKESESIEEIKLDEGSIEQADDVVTEDESNELPIEESVSTEENTNLDSEEDILQKEAEIARLAAEVERLRSSMVGAAEVIEELENPPMPPIVEDDVVIAAHTVADIARMARQLDRDELVRASMGAIAMLHPETPEVLISTKHSAMLPRMNEKDICASKLGGKSPRGAPEDWRVLEVLLASASLVTGGPAAVIHAHGPYTTAVSCEKDLVLMQPIDEIGKEHIGKIIIVDPDPENPEEFLRQVAEALQQGGMRCVVVRGKGSYAVGADLDQAWANAAMLEHSMKIVMLARQANLKV
jgi:ribulose-5-phosphate 4-epimerase/fuculose-1-phosphate aldolase